MSELIGIAAGVLTTVCWLPQALRIVRSKSAKDISLATQCAFTAGIFLWLIYGMVIESPALILSQWDHVSSDKCDLGFEAQIWMSTGGHLRGLPNPQRLRAAPDEAAFSRASRDVSDLAPIQGAELGYSRVRWEKAP